MTQQELYEEYRRTVIRTENGQTAISFYTWLRNIGVM